MLASWNDGAAKSAIVDFVARVTKEGGTEYVPPSARIATFDNDGTLWCEQPMQAQVFFLVDRIKELAAKDPSMKERQPFKAAARARHEDAALAWQAGHLRARLRRPRWTRPPNTASPSSA